jgi:hypothetical protein
VINSSATCMITSARYNSRQGGGTIVSCEFKSVEALARILSSRSYNYGLMDVILE